MKSFPDVVQLCKSSIPGKKYGVAAKQHIPVGTWIGPYEGKKINPDEVNPNMDSSYLWEVRCLKNYNEYSLGESTRG